MQEIKGAVEVINGCDKKLPLDEALADDPYELILSSRAFIIGGVRYDLGDAKNPCFIDDSNCVGHVIADKFLIKSGNGEFYLYRFPGSSDHMGKITIECDDFVAVIDAHGDAKAYKIHAPFAHVSVMSIGQVKEAAEEFELPFE